MWLDLGAEAPEHRNLKELTRRGTSLFPVEPAFRLSLSTNNGDRFYELAQIDINGISSPSIIELEAFLESLLA